MAIGSLCLVLHGHLPYVLRHGVWPHGEDWLYEAAAETYLPILATVNECNFFNARAHITIGLTPVLLEQLAHEDFKKGFEKFIDDRVQRAREDRKEFQSWNNGHLAYLAQRWEEFYQGLAKQFAEIGRDIPRAYAQAAKEGLIEILTSAATHAYLPLLYEDSCIRAQVRAGLASSERILGFRPRGMWLPECAYRPCGPWKSPVGWAPKEYRMGIERIIADEGIDHVFLEDHLVRAARSEWVRNDGHWHKVGWDEADKYATRGWRSIHEAHLLNSDGSGPGSVAVFGRDPKVCEQVWSGDIGYPANGVYLEFHKRHGARRGLRYWKITSSKSDLGAKDMYYPDDVAGRVHEHAVHFCNLVKSRLWEHHHKTGRHGVVTASFDAELFGHWWFEGPRFLRDVILTLNSDPDVDLQTAGGYLQSHQPDMSVWVPEGSWGDGGDHRVWSNERVNWMWDIEYRCEALFGKLTFEQPWAKDPQVRQLLQKAGRELLLLQASDWQFVVTRGQAVDYGIKRFIMHASRLETLIDLCEKLSHDYSYLGKLTEVEAHEVEDGDLHDVIFQDINLDWWRM